MSVDCSQQDNLSNLVFKPSVSSLSLSLLVALLVLQYVQMIQLSAYTYDNVLFDLPYVGLCPLSLSHLVMQIYKDGKLTDSSNVHVI